MERERMEYPCMHCRSERVVAPLSEMVGFNRRHPVAGLGSALDALCAYVRPETLVAVCPGCMCVTADLNGVHAH